MTPAAVTASAQSLAFARSCSVDIHVYVDVLVCWCADVLTCQDTDVLMC